MARATTTGQRGAMWEIAYDAPHFAFRDRRTAQKCNATEEIIAVTRALIRSDRSAARSEPMTMDTREQGLATSGGPDRRPIAAAPAIAPDSDYLSASSNWFRPADLSDHAGAKSLGWHSAQLRDRPDGRPRTAAWRRIEQRSSMHGGDRLVHCCQ